MRLSTRMAATAAVLALGAAGAPAHAGCVGCGGAAVPGGATVHGVAYGIQHETNGTPRHVLDVSCSYGGFGDASAASGSTAGVTGHFTADAVASGPYRADLTTSVRVVCTLSGVGAGYLIDQSKTSQGSDADAWDAKTVPASTSSAVKVCVTADATWDNGLAGSDSASFRQCAYGRGGFVGLNDLTAELQLPLPV
jgi:hypothetical protein